MWKPVVAVLALLIPCVGMAQDRRIPVSVSRTGVDQVGALFVVAFKRELSQSARYAPMPPHGVSEGTRFFVELATIDVEGSSETGRGKRSAISVVVEVMGEPGSFPVPSMWYHKIFLADRQDVHSLAKTLLEDIDARWCSNIRNSPGGCPKENLSPTL